MLLDVLLLGDCDYFVGTLSSQMSRLALALISQRLGGLPPFFSVEGWCVNVNVNVCVRVRVRVCVRARARARARARVRLCTCACTCVSMCQDLRLHISLTYTSFFTHA